MVSTLSYTDIILIIVFSNKRCKIFYGGKSGFSYLFSMICLYMNKSMIAGLSSVLLEL